MIRTVIMELRLGTAVAGGWRDQDSLMRLV